MEADKKKNGPDQTTARSPIAKDELIVQDGRNALLSVQAELRSVVQMARVLANEGPPISENEARKTAKNIASRLKASGDAFGEEAVLFQELIPERAKNLLR
ncbi:MAG: hypothetical protein ACO3XO_04050 [Bdellovibrionota bacterium]|jgi:hypothetical protein